MSPYPYPTFADALVPPTLTKEDLGSEPFEFKWILNGQRAKFWIQRQSFLFGQIAERPTPYQNANMLALRSLTNNVRMRRVVDVGLNIGMMSAQYAGFADRVTAFEPTPKLIEMAAKNLVLNNAYQNVDCYELAIADKSGTMNFSDITDNGAINRLASDTAHLKTNRKSSTCFKVKVETIDRFGFDDVDAIKIDTEGSELLVIQGAVDTIKRCKPIVQAELMLTTITNWKWPNGSKHHPQDGFDMLANLGYKMYYSNLLQYPYFRGSETRQKWVYRKGFSDVFFIHESKILDKHANEFQKIYL